MFKNKGMADNGAPISLLVGSASKFIRSYTHKGTLTSALCNETVHKLCSSGLPKAKSSQINYRNKEKCRLQSYRNKPKQVFYAYTRNGRYNRVRC
jgi:hypothetical protein